MTHAPALADRSALAAIAEQGRTLILSLQDEHGAYPASPTFSAYRGYSWFRDGAFIADAMSAAGEVASAGAFFDWCGRVISSCAPQIEGVVAAARDGRPLPDSEMMPTRFALDGRPGDDEWWDFQLDGYGLWLWALDEHRLRHGLDPAPWAGSVALTVDYLASSWQRPCFDWWEEHVDEVHISTLGCIVAGLRAAVGLGVLDDGRRALAIEAADGAERLLHERGVVDGHLVKWIGSDTIDASLAALIAPLRVLDESTPLAKSTVAELDAQLVADGGMHRFLADTYFGGGQWPLLSCLLGLAWARVGRPERAMELLRWAASTAGADGAMPEQVDRHLLDPSFVDEWVQRWGPSADPLLWSSAMYLRLAVELGVVES